MARVVGCRIGLVLVLVLSPLAVQAQVIAPGKSATTSIGDALIEIIKANQARFVRESWGEQAFQSFTDDDLRRFYADRTTSKIAVELTSDKQFQAVAKRIRDLPSAQREEILTRAASTYKPTWAQLGKIDRSGQTDAGQKAEKEIAQTIVNLVKGGR